MSEQAKRDGTIADDDLDAVVGGVNGPVVKNPPHLPVAGHPPSPVVEQPHHPAPGEPRPPKPPHLADDMIVAN